MKAYKIEVLIVDHENLGLEEIASGIENTRYIYPQVITTKEAEIGEWNDDHPLNQSLTWKSHCEKLFS